MKEEKYFIGYAAYYNSENGKQGYDIFGKIIHIDEEITSKLLSEINDSLIERFNKGTENSPYTVVQVFNIVKLD